MPHKPYDLLIFDWDGTLMDSAGKIVACLRQAAISAELPIRSDNEFRHIIGLGMHEAIDYLYPEGMSDATRAMFIETYKQEFVYKNQTQAALFAGVEAMLDTLLSQGYYLAIATGKSRAGLDRLLGELSLARYFHLSRCADETSSKPDPHMLHEILTDLDMPAVKALMIGDTTFDIEMAHNAKMTAAAVAQGTHSIELLQKHRPLVILEQITQLLPWLQQAHSLSD